MSGSRADQFEAMTKARQCECAIVACKMALEAWERLLPEGGASFSVPDAGIIGRRLERSFGRDVLDATRRHRDRIGQPMGNEIERLCLDMDLAVSTYELDFDDPAVEWAGFSFLNLVLAAAGLQKTVSDDVPFRNPFLLAVNQACTAVAFFRSRKDGEKPSWSTDSIDDRLLSSVVDEWWARCSPTS
jgi:hypothetical protein